MKDEQSTELCASLLSCLVERGEVPTVQSIDRAVMLDQQGGHVNMLGGGGTQDQVMHSSRSEY